MHTNTRQRTRTHTHTHIPTHTGIHKHAHKHTHTHTLVCSHVSIQHVTHTIITHTQHIPGLIKEESELLQLCSTEFVEAAREAGLFEALLAVGTSPGVCVCV